MSLLNPDSTKLVLYFWSLKKKHFWSLKRQFSVSKLLNYWDLTRGLLLCNMLKSYLKMSVLLLLPNICLR